MSFENISKINVIGRPEITVPAGMPVETVLDTMNINIADYDQAIEGSTLVLSVAAGTKGLIDTRIVNGKLLPVGGTSFPTNADIENIAKLFPDDNLFETLNDPAKLQHYFTTLEEKSEELVKEAIKAKEEAAKKRVEDDVKALTEGLSHVLAYAAKLDNPHQKEIAHLVKETNDKVKILLASAESAEVERVQEEDEKAKREAILAQIREANPALGI
jgi:hypothetical protein